MFDAFNLMLQPRIAAAAADFNIRVKLNKQPIQNVSLEAGNGI